MKSAIKVCFIMPKAYPLFNSDCKEVFGGAEVDFFILATELAKDKNFSVSFIVADYGQPSIESRQNVTIIKSFSFKKNLISRTMSLWRAMRQADAEIYLQKAVSWGTLFVAKFCKLHKRCFVYRTATAGECNGTWPKKYFERKAFWLSLRWANSVLTQNVVDRKNLLSTLDVSSVAIPNGHVLSPPDQYNRETILWVGRSDKLKRPDVFIDLAEEIPDERFVMICQHATGDNEYEKLTNRARQIKNLEFIERVSFTEIDSYFQKAKIFVNTSDMEGFPNTFIQACKSGTPILSLNVNPDGFLDSHKCGLFARGDWQTFKNQLTELLSDSGDQYGQNARKYAEENHDITKIIKLYKDIFYDLVRSDADNGS